VSKSKARSKKIAKGRRNALILICVALCLAGGIVARWRPFSIAPKFRALPGPVPTPAPSLNLSKEYIYAGNRLIATEEPSFLNAPSGLVVALWCQAHLHWSDNSSNETSFNIERSVDGGATFSVFTTVAANVTQAYSLPRPGYKEAPYLYRVRASSALGDSAPSNTVSVPSLPSGTLCAEGVPRFDCLSPFFFDDFNDNARDTAKWNLVTAPNAVSVLEQNQRLEISPSTTSAAYNGYQTAASVDMTNAQATVQVVQTTASVGSAETLFGIWGAGGGFVFCVEGGNIFFQQYAGGLTQTSVPYDAVQHRFWRIRHDGAPDRILWETSPDTFTWQTQRSEARPFAINAMYPSLYAGKWGGEVSQPGTAIFDDLRIERAYRFFDNFDDNIRDTTKWNLVSAPNAVSVLEQNQRLEVAPSPSGSGYNGYQTALGVDLTSAQAVVELVQATAPVGSADTLFGVWGAGGVVFCIEGGNLFFQLYAGGFSQAYIPYNATQHRFLRIRHDGATDRILWETSADALTWTTQRNEARTFAINAMYPSLYAGKWANEVTQPGTAIFDNFRVVDNCTAP